MNQEPVSQLRIELGALSRLSTSSPLKSVTDAYNRILQLVQAMMLNNDNPDAHARAWSLINDDAYKDMTEIQEGRIKAIDGLQQKMSQLRELLLTP